MGNWVNSSQPCRLPFLPHTQSGKWPSLIGPLVPTVPINTLGGQSMVIPYPSLRPRRSCTPSHTPSYTIVSSQNDYLITHIYSSIHINSILLMHVYKYVYVIHWRYTTVHTTSMYIRQSKQPMSTLIPVLYWHPPSVSWWHRLALHMRLLLLSPDLSIFLPFFFLSPLVTVVVF